MHYRGKLGKKNDRMNDAVRQKNNNSRHIVYGSKYGLEINIDKSQVMNHSRSKVNNKELKEVDHFKCFGNVLTRDGYCTRDIMIRIATVKEAFNKKIWLVITSKLNI